MSNSRRILVTGGAGYVGAVLCPKLLEAGYQVRVLDTCWYGSDVFPSIAGEADFELIVGDIRNAEDVRMALEGCTDVIHLACISNDPSYDLDPKLGEEVNYRAFEPLVHMAKAAGVKRFIYASSSSVYGIKDEEQVTEDLKLEPLTDYSRFKALCEEILNSYADDQFVVTTIRPATVCGYSPRQRLDVIVNILVNHAVNRGVIRVFGGAQFRPNLHIDDMCRAYLDVLQQPAELVQREIFNVGGINHTVAELADIVQANIDRDAVIEIEPTDDNRSYRISSERIREKLEFQPHKDVADAVKELVEAFNLGLLPASLEDSRYFNIRRMGELVSDTAAH